MTSKQYNHAVSIGELRLSIGEKCEHFIIVGFLLFIPLLSCCFHLFAFFKGQPTRFFQDDEVYLLVGSIILALLFYLIQKRRLRFKKVETSLNQEDLYKIILDVGKELGWVIMQHNKKFVTAKTNPPFFSGSWGEQITILFTGNCVLINSICDLDKKASVVSFGRNRKNEETFLAHIQKANEELLK